MLLLQSILTCLPQLAEASRPAWHSNNAWAPLQDVHPDLWKGANRKFDKIPWRKLEAERHNAERTPEHQVSFASCVNRSMHRHHAQGTSPCMCLHIIRLCEGACRMSSPRCESGEHACHEYRWQCLLQQARLARALRRDRERQKRILDSGIEYSYEPLQAAVAKKPKHTRIAQEDDAE